MEKEKTFEDYLAMGYRSIGHYEVIEYLAKEVDGEITFVEAHNGKVISPPQKISVGALILLHDFLQEHILEDDMGDD